mmetsp:Transcript_118240/g.329776  ORF Transcript_118240/g.329776 Transcript_118240/m.329776 type:complete len:204 (-) Transcript_118240:418-1029(-)
MPVDAFRHSLEHLVGEEACSCRHARIRRCRICHEVHISRKDDVRPAPPVQKHLRRFCPQVEDIQLDGTVRQRVNGVFISSHSPSLEAIPGHHCPIWQRHLPIMHSDWWNPFLYKPLGVHAVQHKPLPVLRHREDLGVDAGARPRQRFVETKVRLVGCRKRLVNGGKGFDGQCGIAHDHKLLQPWCRVRRPVLLEGCPQHLHDR